MIPSLAVAGSVIKLALSIALTFKTQWWWAPGSIMIAFGVSLLVWSSWVLGAVGIGLGSLGLATSAALRAPIAATRL